MKTKAWKEGVPGSRKRGGLSRLDLPVSSCPEPLGPFPIDKLQLAGYLRDGKGFDEGKPAMPVPIKNKASLQNTTYNRTCSFSFSF